ncbi:hypothetical protein BDU57DRAFT_596721 [Ampelomyces quisqualis]|uniref:C2 domain-containing protein n=1 Tax=Ampelomyces quisqualis TaxID=50730 RepID=A0A6A5QLE1_AMPQU|nr:hypothetical protein BDU57DRAFT_596721 [Ampelomyces quisqualis]
MSGVEDVNEQRRSYKAPHNARNPIPTVQKYREEKQRRHDDYGHAQADDETNNDGRTARDKLGDAYNAFTGSGPDEINDGEGPYAAENKNLVAAQDVEEADDHSGETANRKNRQLPQDTDDDEEPQDSTEGHLHESDPKKARKQMKKFNADGTEREVTDPITHLPVKIHDFTDKDLKRVDKNEGPPGSQPRTMTGMENINKSDEHLEAEEKESKDAHTAMEVLFPPPDFEATRTEITYVYTRSLTIGLGAVIVSLLLVDALFWPTRMMTGWRGKVWKAVQTLTMLGVAAGVSLFMRQYTHNRIKNVWDVEVWQAERKRGKKLAKSQTAESAQWLNSMFSSVWPLINPDLFTSIADTLEDVMQASLPSLVRMVAVEDVGQGSEALRILGVRWLPTGAAARSVSAEGKLKTPNEEKDDRTVQDDNEDQEQLQRQDTMEAEEGDFVNVEIAFAYRPSTGRGIKSRAKHAHLYLAFYLPGKVKIPVWVELTGIVGVVRLRLQLCPDPPFFSICTMSFLGQPKVTLSCVPLIKKGPNLMDVPLMSSFVQSSMDAALAEYVAPKSLTLDLKDMMMGDDFKKDTVAQGVLIVRIKHAYDFKEGDGGLGPLKEGSSDPYVSVGWAKFGKPVWSTRVLLKNMDPHWEETCFVNVTPQELNVDERLRLQLWDSDRSSADDDLGRIELDLKEIMKSDESNGKMHDREDGFKAMKAGEAMPGKLSWSIGYFSKTRITDQQLADQDEDPDVKNIDQLKKKVYGDAEQKLREASADHQNEVEQQKKEDFHARQDQLIIASPPSEDYPSGILSIQVHQITGLELEKHNKDRNCHHAEASDDEEEGDDLPSAYCTIIINHKKVFRTRTKPKNNKPFFNAGCERFIRDVRNTEVHIAVRDARVHEDDPLLGIIYLPLEKVFDRRSQINSTFPLSGGVGYGRARVSMVFRSLQCQLPKQMLGWDYGTVEIQPTIKAFDLPQDIQKLRLKVRNHTSRGKYQSCDNEWKTKNDKPVRLPIRMRYATPLIVEFRQNAALRDHTPAFAILWVKDIPDNEQQTLRLTVWKGDLKRAEDNVLSSYGDKIGEIEITLTFWSGLSGCHEKFAKGDKHMTQVMEVLDVANDQEWSDWDDDKDGPKDGSKPGVSQLDEDSDTSDSDSEGSNFLPDFLQKDKKRDSRLSENGSRGVIDQVKDYKDSAKQLHRKNRGAMQWKGPRTLAWMKHVGDRGKHKVGGLFKHHERTGTGIETEA